MCVDKKEVALVLREIIEKVLRELTETDTRLNPYLIITKIYKEIKILEEEK